MALKVIMLRKKLDDKLTELRSLESAKSELRRREQDLERAIEEAQTEEEKKVVEENVDQFQKDQDANETSIEDIKKEIEDIKKQIKAVEEKIQEEEPVAEEPSEDPNKNTEKRKRGVGIMTKRFHGQTPEQRSAYLGRSDVKEFYHRVADLIREKRAVSGSELLIPDVVLDLLRDNMDQYSKLIKYVRLRRVGGKARQTIAGDIPEAIWTEATGKLNELNLDFSAVEVDGYKVGGYIPVHNSVLEDSVLVSLANEIETMLGLALGLALDKAIIYGTGTKMPLGFVARLAQASAPEGKEEGWVNLSTSNVKKIDGTTKTGIDLFKEILKALANAKSRHSRNGMVLCMNETTWNSVILPESLSVNSAGAMVAATNGTFPAIGAKVEFLDFIPDGDVVGGYLEKYLLAERAGGSIKVSEHARFIEDQTVFRGTARYDGLPVRADSFIALNLQNKAPTTSVTFGTDTANTVTEDDSESQSLEKAKK